jgi:DNA polymerase-3 subunit delta'
MQPGVIGHVAARARLMALLERARLPGGILLHGPRGIGKATLAFELARRIFTRTGDEDEAAIAAQVAAGAYPNLRVLRKVPRETGRGFYTAIRVDEVRGFVEELRMTRGRAGHRVGIIDAADDCNPSSANALLKILEEPPADTTFLLISHRPGGLLPTIRSRCQAVALRPLSDAEVAAVLAANGADPARVPDAAALAGGRPRRAFEALALTDDGPLQALAAWLRDPLQQTVAQMLGTAEALGADRAGASYGFASDMLRDWLAAEARAAAVAGARARLASASELWEKATALLADADEYNLDARQTLIGILDWIRAHAETHLVPTPAP